MAFSQKVEIKLKNVGQTLFYVCPNAVQLNLLQFFPPTPLCSFPVFLLSFYSITPLYSDISLIRAD